MQIGQTNWNPAKQLLLLAGPCVIESQALCVDIAGTVKETCARLGIAYVFKASFDKANRSSGSSFRGQGLEKGLEILAAVGKQMGVPVVTDVHESEQCAPVGHAVDMLQIPAFLCRQTDLLLAAAKTGKPVNVKKGQFMSPGEMVNAVEKIRTAGNAHVLLTERGTFFGYNRLVNDFTAIPQMQALHAKDGDAIPVLMDATHSAQLPGGLGGASGGQRQYVPLLSRCGIVAGADGLFIEVHPTPEKAASDAATMLALADLPGLLEECLALRQAMQRAGTTAESLPATERRVLMLDLFHHHPNLIDWIVFLAVYVGLALGTIPFTRLDRASIALLGAVALLVAQKMSFSDAVGHLEFRTLALLFALMVLSAQLHVAGFYNVIIERIIATAHRPWTLLIGVVLSAALLSALFANDIICLVFAPVLCVGMQRAGRQPIPYLIALATASNIGSAATLIGNPQNMLIGQTAHLSFAHYSLTVAPLVVTCLGLNLLTVALVYRRDIFRPPLPHAASQSAAPANALPHLFDRWRTLKTLGIMAALVVVFLLGETRTGMTREVAALAAAGCILVSRKTEPRALLAQVDWRLILLFMGLFVVIADAQEKGLLNHAMNLLHVPRDTSTSPGALSALTLALSNIVSNVPAVLLLQPPHAADWPVRRWYLLAVVSTLAGNLTLLGSIANLIVAEQSKPNGVEIGWTEYLKVGVPLTICNTVLAMGYFSYL